jgi:hypothetical protein
MNTNRLSGASMSALRKIAIATGILYLITHVTSIVAGIQYDFILKDPAYITGSGPATALLVAAFLEVILVLANVGTGTLPFPILKQQNEGIALSYLSLRVLEAGIIAVGILPILALVTLRQQAASADPAVLAPIGQALVSLHEGTMRLATNFIYGAHTVLLAYLLYKSRLVPRFIPVLMLIGGPAVLLLGTAVMFGLVPPTSPLAGVAALSALSWELSFATWLIFKGFNPSAAASSLESGLAPAGERLSAA